MINSFSLLRGGIFFCSMVILVFRKSAPKERFAPTGQDGNVGESCSTFYRAFAPTGQGGKWCIQFYRANTIRVRREMVDPAQLSKHQQGRISFDIYEFEIGMRRFPVP
jgi:hypothetical protein